MDEKRANEILNDHMKEEDGSLREQQSKFIRLLSRLINHAYARGYELTGGDLWASHGHKKSSLHYVRLAIDLNLFKDGKYLRDTESHRSLGEYWERLNPDCRWGGRWSDGNHYEMLQP